MLRIAVDVARPVDRRNHGLHRLSRAFIGSFLIMGRATLIMIMGGSP
jgi:hypothetical protein